MMASEAIVLLVHIIHVDDTNQMAGSNEHSATEHRCQHATPSLCCFLWVSARLLKLLWLSTVAGINMKSTNQLSCPRVSKFRTLCAVHSANHYHLTPLHRSENASVGETISALCDSAPYIPQGERGESEAELFLRLDFQLSYIWLSCEKLWIRFLDIFLSI